MNGIRRLGISLSALVAFCFVLSSEAAFRPNFFGTNQLSDAIEQTNTIILSGFHLALKTNDISGANGTYTWNGSTKYVFNSTNTVSLISGQWTYTNGMSQIAPPSHAIFAADASQTPTVTAESWYWFDDIGIILGQSKFTRSLTQTSSGPYVGHQSDNSTNQTLWQYPTLGNDGTGLRWNGSGGGNLGSGLDLIPILNPIIDGGQRTLYMGGPALDGTGLEAASIQVVNTNTTGQTNGLLAPRITLAFLNTAANAGQTHAWRFEPNDLTLNNNTDGNGVPEVIIHHDNTTNIMWGAADWTNWFFGRVLNVVATNGIVVSNAPVAFQGSNGEVMQLASATEQLTLSTGAATTDTSANLLPANSIIESVVTRVTTTITTAATFSVGDPTTAARFSASAAGITANSTRVGIDQWSGAVATLAGGPSQAAAAKVRITCNTTPGAGVIRITVFYKTFTPPTQ